jgi:putative ABC transport system permease protein
MHALLQDLKFALRILRKNPGFTVVAGLTLALGIGANTAIFSLVHAVVLQPLGYADAGRLVSVQAYEKRSGTHGVPLSLPKFQLLAEESKTLESSAVYYFWEVGLVTPREPEVVSAARVSSDFFRVLRVAPARGRTFLAQEDQPGAAEVAMVTDGFWHSHFAADEEAVGKTLVLDGVNATIIGILPAQFRFPFASPEPQIFLTRVSYHPFLKPVQVNLGAGYLAGIARMRDGARVAQVKAEMGTINGRYAKQFASHADAANHEIEIESLQENLVGDLRGLLLVLLAAVGLVLLIACANVANLLLARGSAREKEMALRKALGASSGRLVAQLLSESCVLSFLGGMLGVLLAAALMPVLRAMKAAGLPRLAEVRLDAPVLLFSLLLCVLTAVLFGLAPALQAAGKHLQEALKEGVRGSSGGGGRGKFRAVLVAAEIALAMVLMTGAGLLMESFTQLLHVNLGFAPQGLMTFPISLPTSRYAQPAQQAEFFRQALQRVRSLPSVESAGFVSFLPLSGGRRLSYFCMEGQICQGMGKDPLLVFWQVSPGYLETMRTPLVQGRLFDEHDSATGAPVVLVNEAVAQHYWPKQSALGKHLSGARETFQREVVGVVADAKVESPNSPAAEQLYVPADQQPYAGMTLVVRSAAPEQALIEAVRGKIGEVDPTIPIAGVRSMEEVVGAAVSRPRLLAMITGIFAGLALLLAAVGIYGVMAYTVSTRKQEMGIRLALGAEPAEILKLVVGQGMRMALIGVGAGILFSLVLTRLLETLLFGVGARDPLVFGAASLVLMGVAFFACYLPARRATRVDPIAVLRYE